MSLQGYSLSPTPVFVAVANYVAEQEEHHSKRSYSEELRLLVDRYRVAVARR